MDMVSKGLLYNLYKYPKETNKMGNTIVEFKNVTKQYGQGEAIQLANNDVNFTIEEGEFVVILGSSGAG